MGRAKEALRGELERLTEKEALAALKVVRALKGAVARTRTSQPRWTGTGAGRRRGLARPKRVDGLGGGTLAADAAAAAWKTGLGPPPPHGDIRAAPETDIRAGMRRIFDRLAADAAISVPKDAVPHFKRVRPLKGRGRPASDVLIENRR